MADGEINVWVNERTPKHWVILNWAGSCFLIFLVLVFLKGGEKTALVHVLNQTQQTTTANKASTD